MVWFSASSGLLSEELLSPSVKVSTELTQPQLPSSVYLYQKEHSSREAIEHLVDHFNLTKEQRQELLSSGTQPVFNNRVGWANTYLKKAGLLESPRRGRLKITSRGLEALKTNAHAINNDFLRQYPEFIEFLSKTKKPAQPAPPVSDQYSLSEPPGISQESSDSTPEETIEDAYESIRNEVVAELLQQIMGCSPAFFERLVVDLLVAMGYDGTRREAGKVIGKSGDEGIDGIINEDRLGLDVIYIQAKRWEGTVGRPEIQRFVGALQGRRARKGVFITTSSFSDNAIQYAAMLESRVVLIDGVTLANLMIDNDIGVSPVANYQIHRVDSDYFNEA
jgi:restriction system protein